MIGSERMVKPCKLYSKSFVSLPYDTVLQLSYFSSLCGQYFAAQLASNVGSVVFLTELYIKSHIQ